MGVGRLVIAGTGIQFGAHITRETEQWIVVADKVFYAANNPLVGLWLQTLNGSATSLASHFAPAGPRRESYEAIVETLLGAVRQGETVCALFYGHPGAFVHSSHVAVAQAQAEGFAAIMLPGISAEACLYADLGLDPSRHGMQSYEAANFLLRPRRWDVHSGLLLWQIGMIGNEGMFDPERAPAGLDLLATHLLLTYPAGHCVILYEAAYLPLTAPQIQQVDLADLFTATVTQLTTLYVPPLAPAPIDPAMAVRIDRLGQT